VPRAILFDLDGTLVDTRAASWELFAETNARFGLGVDTREDYFRAFEGNFFDSLAKICPDRERAAAAKQHFMELLRTRYKPTLIPGMGDVVKALAPHCTLAVISTNGIETIRRILVDAGIATCFSHVFSGDVQPKKSASIRRFLGDQSYAAQRCCSPEYRDGSGSAPGLVSADVVLVTDTAGDVIEAREAGIRAIGVAWGMHGERQLLDAGAEKVALWPQELVAWLRPAACDAAVACACNVSDGGQCDVPPARPGVPTHPEPNLRERPVRPGAAPSETDAAKGRTQASLVAMSGRLRRERQLRSRTDQVAAGGRTPELGRAPRTPGAPEAELVRALHRIVSRPAA